MITLHASAVLHVRDGYTGAALEGSSLLCTLDGAPIRPLAKAMARSQALLPGQEITPEEDEALIAALLSSAEAAYSPDGLKTFTIIDNPSLSKLFH